MINRYGDRKVVETKNFDEELKQLNESTDSPYYLDVEWYLSNGYKLIEEIFHTIESNGNSGQ